MAGTRSPYETTSSQVTPEKHAPDEANRYPPVSLEPESSSISTEYYVEVAEAPVVHPAVLPYEPCSVWSADCTYDD